ncbi:GNAT family N-acetyltransferase [Streptomyces sp. NPDC090106]|uniref:GNAT family N-acetyltransferase n=1 Tax=Streptomyces sp. NPDC090106 TaxID=3365946 RepID=UPI0038174800
MDVTIRAAHPTEYGTLGEITAQAYLQDGLLAFGGEDDWYLHELRDVAKRAAGAEVLVAVDRDRVLGGVTYVPAPGPLSDLAAPDEAEIRMLAVAREARGRGAGEALVRACVERARAAGRTGLVLSTQPSMRAAHRVYGRLGFVRAPARDWRPIEGDDFTLLAYQLTL